MTLLDQTSYLALGCGPVPVSLAQVVRVWYFLFPLANQIKALVQDVYANLTED